MAQPRDEAELILELAAIFESPGGAPASGGAPGSDGTLLGIGDDAAVLAPGSEPLVWSIDAAVEGVHFRRAWLSPEDLGYRATMAAASDLAAMGASARGVLASVVVPVGALPASGATPGSAAGPVAASAWDNPDLALLAIARGQRAACDLLGTRVVGGNLSRGGEWSIATTVLGATARPLRRDGARPGDLIYLAGSAGLARAGFLALSAGREREPELAAAVLAWRRPTALLDAGRAAARVAHGGIDVSDGLALDTHRLATASGVALLIEEARLVQGTLHAAALHRSAHALGTTPLELALAGGEDYALVVTAPPDAGLASRFVCIGHVEAAPAPSVSLVTSRGRRAIEPRGFDHFRDPAPGVS